MSERKSLRAGLAAVLAVGAIWSIAAQTRRTAPVPAAGEGVSFRVIFGERRAGERTYDGSIAVAGGRVAGLTGWRFFGGDTISGPVSWKLSIKGGPFENQPDRPATLAGGAVAPLNLVPAGLMVTVSAGAVSATVRTAQGSFEVPVRDLRYGRRLSFLEGDATVERVPSPIRQSREAAEQHDYPSIAAARDGRIWTAWQGYRDSGDHIYARVAGGTVERVTPKAADVHGTAIAQDREGRIHLAWSEREGDRWLLRESVNARGSWSTPARITDAHPPNMAHRFATNGEGELWLVWVGYEGGESYVYVSHWDGRGWSEPRRAGGPGVWSPSAAVDRAGDLHVAWDSYAAGNYDVYYRRVPLRGDAGAIEQITNSPRFEAHASVAVDGSGRPWVAWDASGANWGKDWSREDQNRATTLYADRSIRIAVRQQGKWMQAGEFSSALPERSARYAQLPRLAFDAAGRAWVLFQVRTSTENTHEDVWATGGLWDLYLTSLDETGWRPGSFVPQSTARPEAPFAIIPGPGGVWMAWATDGRTYRGKAGNHELPTVVHYDVYTARAGDSGPAAAPALTALTFPVVRPQRIHPDERGDVARIRAWRTKVNGAEYRILRGDFHRHTEISYDGAGDGSLEDYYRYMLDGAAMDTGIVGDHNMGGDVEYSWWRTEKSYDLYRIPGRFTPLFGYERSVRYPNGHRNVVFDHRGVKTLPVGREENQGQVNSGTIVYPYLRQNRGICMEHSLATNQGTDYRDNDPALEPLVEIYQGYHANYEYAGAPRAESNSRNIALHGPYQGAGFWWNALAKGLRLGVQASSDHISTHCSYAMVYTPSAGRTEIVEAMRKRHAYAATDNIILDFQAEGADGERHLMGDDFAFSGRPVLHGRIAGTAPVAAVDLIRNNEFVYTQRPGRDKVEFTYIDQSPKAGLNWYYVRVLQEDGNLAWSSPIWIRR